VAEFRIPNLTHLQVAKGFRFRCFEFFRGLAGHGDLLRLLHDWWTAVGALHHEPCSVSSRSSVADVLLHVICMAPELDWWPMDFDPTVEHLGALPPGRLQHHERFIPAASDVPGASERST